MPTKKISNDSLPPWYHWPNGMSRHARAIKFIETQCRAPKGYNAGELIKLAEFQKNELEEILAPGVHAAVCSMPRGNGKSTFKAALCLWATFDPGESGDPQVPVIATTVKQAMKTIYDPACRMIQLNDDMSSRCRVLSSITDPKIDVPYCNGQMFPIADLPDGLQGLDPSLGVVDEIGFMGIDSWASLLLSTGKRPDSLILAIGTPGFDKENALWFIRTNHHEGATDVHYTEYAADKGCDVHDQEQWRKSNPAYVAGFKGEHAFTTALSLGEPMFRIFQLGQWVDGVLCWLGEDSDQLWRSLAQPYEFVPGAPTWVGIDIAKQRDTSAVVMIQKRPDGRMHAKAKIWKPPVDLLDVVDYLRFIKTIYKLQGCSYDKKLFEIGAELLVKEGLPMHETPQSAERMTPIVGNAFDAIKRLQITHDGDYDFTMQVLNAVPHLTPIGFTLEKTKAKNKIDGAVALCLAIDEALRSKVRTPLIML